VKRILLLVGLTAALGGSGFIAAAAIVTETHPYTHTYTDAVTISAKGKPITYTVVGTVSGTITEQDTIPDPVTVTVTTTGTTTTAPPANRSPVACFTYTPVSPVVGQTVNFSAACSSDPDGDTLTYEWEIVWPVGDFERSGVNTSYAYTSTGTKSFSLRVSDGRGETATVNGTLTVSAASPPPATTTITTQPPTTTGELKANVWVVPAG
jgi:hypothetical protein